jgi:hypothetical protein
MRVGDPPERHRVAPGLGDARADDVTVDAPLRGEPRRPIARQHAHLDVHLAHRDAEPEVRQAPDVRADVPGARRRVGAEVHLQADAVDRHVLRDEAADQLEHAVGLVAQPFRAVVVVEEECAGVGRVRDPERLGDVPGAQPAREHRVAQQSARVRHRLVHDVPGGDAAAIAAHHRPDVLDHRGPQPVRRQRRHPRRELLVPDERVALDAHGVRLGEGDDVVRGREVEPVGLRVDRAPLHRVLGREGVEPRREGRPVPWLGHQRLVGDGGPQPDGRPYDQGVIAHPGWAGGMLAVKEVDSEHEGRLRVRA